MKRSPIKVKTHRNCEYHGCRKEFKKRKTTDKYCSSKCEIDDKGYPEKKPPISIPKKSKNKQVADLKYIVVRKEFLGKPENQICPVTGQPTVEVHHQSGRRHDQYADEWARQNNVCLLIDVRFFLAVSREGHDWIEANPNEAKELGYSVSRLEKKD
jgi:hypothetical protein